MSLRLCVYVRVLYGEESVRELVGAGVYQIDRQSGFIPVFIKGERERVDSDGWNR